MKVLILDCYDSFTFNLYQLIGELGGEPIVLKSDSKLDDVIALDFDRIVLSPGPGRPEASGVCLDVLQEMSPYVPTLGVCLGHQAIAVSFGARVIGADNVMHGKTSKIVHDGSTMYEGVSSPFTATRYHSLMVDEKSLPPELLISARSLDDNNIMGIRHNKYPIFGVQFHPESILSPDGRKIISNFLYGDLSKSSISTVLQNQRFCETLGA